MYFDDYIKSYNFNSTIKIVDILRQNWIGDK